MFTNSKLLVLKVDNDVTEFKLEKCKILKQFDR